jgi:iron complex outermembrane receptor protein
VFKAIAVKLSVAILLCGVVATAFAMADEAPRAINIPSGNLSNALVLLAKQSGTELMYRPDQVRDIKTHGARGNFTAHEAVLLLLKDTPLELRTEASGALLVIDPSRLEGSSARASADATENESGDVTKEVGKNTSRDFRLAQVDKGNSGPEIAQRSPEVGPEAGQASTGQKPALDEIIVTAQKREERLQDVPVPVSVLNADSLVLNGQTQIQDYYSKVPGLDFNMGIRDEPVAAIRGIFNVYGNPTIGILIDGIQQGSSISNGGGYTVPDIDPAELDHIEVLRGPQGTLYGASSMGGLVNYVTIDPSTAGVTGRLEAGVQGVRNGASTGYSERASINVPLSDTLAVRASAFTRTDPGYVDNVVTGQHGVNLTDSQGGHLAMLWKPSDDMSLKVSALIQGSQRHGAADVEIAPGFSDLQQNNLPGTGYDHLQDHAYSVIFSDKFGGITLKSLTGYNVHTIVDSFDDTGSVGDLAQSTYGVSGAAIPEYQKNRRLSEELRLSGAIGARIDWLVGAFYADEKTTFVQPVTAVDASTGAVAGLLDLSSYPNTYSEYSGFAELTFHFTDRFDVQLGGRESRDHQVFTQTDIGAFQLEGGDADVRTSEDAFTYLLTPRFKISPDLMVYARLASGFRPGSPNVLPSPALLPPGLVLPAVYAPDKTQNYEVGLKGDFLDHRLSIDTSLYYIDWKNLQLSLASEGFGYYANGAAAKSEGIELSVQSRPLTGLTLAGWIASDDAVLTQDLPAASTAYGVAGDRLPLTPHWSGSLSIEQEERLTSQMTGFIGASASYVGERLYNFQPTPQRQSYPAYTKTDLHAGIRIDSWTVNAFVNNAADKRGLLGGGIGYIDPQRFVVIQPRTIGLSVSKAF